MASGKPDWYKSVTMTGWTGTEYTPVLLDESGQLFALIKGLSGTSYLPIKLDADGQMYVLMQGLEGGTTKRTISVDASGNLFALMQGTYGGVLKTIAVDANGVMKANLSAQDLNYLKVRPVYGQGIRDYAPLITINNGAGGYIHQITGRGAIIGGMTNVEHGSIIGDFEIIIYVDGVAFVDILKSSLIKMNPTRSGAQPISLNAYVYDIGRYSWNYNPFVTFETSVGVYVLNTSGYNINFWSSLFYALVP